MTEVEFSRRMGVLVAYLNQAAKMRLFEAVKKSTSFETLQEPYKTWITNPTEISLKDLRENAKQARKGKA
jgi:vacuolar-type H+-ATPase catalytic subunit A/Vma1